jgi:phosphoglycerate dehydrogenase-like enzyme
MKVHWLDTPKAEVLEALQARLSPKITLTTGDTPPNDAYDILVAGRPTRDQLTAAPSLRSVLVPFAGIPPKTSDLLRDFPTITLHNLHYNTPPTAEMALALLFAAAKTIVPSDRALRQNDWTPRYAPAPALLLQGKTALILGYGAIGQHIGTVLKALGMTVIATRRRHSDPDNGIYAADRLHDLLPRAHVLMIAVPGTDDTTDLIGERELALLPQGAVVVNIGRGGVLNQFALYEALKSGHLFGAGLDVWYHYPPNEDAQRNTAPADVPFHELDNIVLSPHRAGGGRLPEIEALRMETLADVLNQAADGNPLPHQVDIRLGY